MFCVTCRINSSIRHDLSLIQFELCFIERSSPSLRHSCDNNKAFGMAWLAMQRATFASIWRRHIRWQFVNFVHDFLALINCSWTIYGAEWCVLVHNSCGWNSLNCVRILWWIGRGYASTDWLYALNVLAYAHQHQHIEMQKMWKRTKINKTLP